MLNLLPGGMVGLNAAPASTPVAEPVVVPLWPAGPAELHIFEIGGHGFGMKSDNRAGASWPPLCESWLRERGLLSAGKPPLSR